MAEKAGEIFQKKFRDCSKYSSFVVNFNIYHDTIDLYKIPYNFINELIYYSNVAVKNNLSEVDVFKLIDQFYGKRKVISLEDIIKKNEKKEKKDKKEKKNLSKNKEEKKKNEETSEKDDTKKSRKLKKSSSLKNIEDKNYKLKKVKKEDDDEPKTSRKNSSKKDKKKKHRNRHKSIEKLAPRLSKVIKNILKGGPEFEKGIRRLNKIDFSEYSGSHDTNLIINHYDDRPTEVFLNDKRIKTDAFDSMFDCFGEIFNENFQNNFLMYIH